MANDKVIKIKYETEPVSFKRALDDLEKVRAKVRDLGRDIGAMQGGLAGAAGGGAARGNVGGGLPGQQQPLRVPSMTGIQQGAVNSTLQGIAQTKNVFASMATMSKSAIEDMTKAMDYGIKKQESRIKDLKRELEALAGAFNRAGDRAKGAIGGMIDRRTSEMGELIGDVQSKQALISGLTGGGRQQQAMMRMQGMSAMVGGLTSGNAVGAVQGFGALMGNPLVQEGAGPGGSTLYLGARAGAWGALGMAAAGYEGWKAYHSYLEQKENLRAATFQDPYNQIVSPRAAFANAAMGVRYNLASLVAFKETWGNDQDTVYNRHAVDTTRNISNTFAPFMESMKAAAGERQIVGGVIKQYTGGMASGQGIGGMYNPARQLPYFPLARDAAAAAYHGFGDARSGWNVVYEPKSAWLSSITPNRGGLQLTDPQSRALRLGPIAEFAPGDGIGADLPLPLPVSVTASGAAGSYRGVVNRSMVPTDEQRSFANVEAETKARVAALHETLMQQDPNTAAMLNRFQQMAPSRIAEMRGLGMGYRKDPYGGAPKPAFDEYLMKMEAKGFERGEVVAAHRAVESIAGRSAAQSLGGSVVSMQAGGLYGAAQIAGGGAMYSTLGGAGFLRSVAGMAGRSRGGIDVGAADRLGQLAAQGLQDQAPVTSGAGYLGAMQAYGRGANGAEDVRIANQLSMGMPQMANLFQGKASPYQTAINTLNAINAAPGASIYGQDYLATQMTPRLMADIMGGGKVPQELLDRGIDAGQVKSFAKETMKSQLFGYVSQGKTDEDKFVDTLRSKYGGDIKAMQADKKSGYSKSRMAELYGEVLYDTGFASSEEAAKGEARGILGLGSSVNKKGGVGDAAAGTDEIKIKQLAIEQNRQMNAVMEKLNPKLSEMLGSSIKLSDGLQSGANDVTKSCAELSKSLRDLTLSADLAAEAGPGGAIVKARHIQDELASGMSVEDVRLRRPGDVQLINKINRENIARNNRKAAKAVGDKMASDASWQDLDNQNPYK